MTNSAAAPDTGHYDNCRKKLELLEKFRTARFMLTVIFTGANTMFVLLGGGSLRYLTGGADNLLAAVPFAILALLLGVTLTVLISQASEKRKLLVFAILLTILGMLLTILNIWMGIAFLIAELTLCSDFRKLDFLQKQEGYPHFSVRFTEQELTSAAGYHPGYDLSANTAEMPDIYEE
ncbi:MAG: hypothetical protein II341_02720 [Oscillospiraceae bacterium]|nr:hypothetical protein [Oscillospiraceae bacterium]